MDYSSLGKCIVFVYLKVIESFSVGNLLCQPFPFWKILSIHIEEKIPLKIIPLY